MTCPAGDPGPWSGCGACVGSHPQKEGFPRWSADGQFCPYWGRGGNRARASPAFREEAGILGLFGGGRREVTRPCPGAMVCGLPLYFSGTAGRGQVASSEGCVWATTLPPAAQELETPPVHLFPEKRKGVWPWSGPRGDLIAHLIPSFL